MLESTETDAFQIELLAQEIVARLHNTSAGHCARVDFLRRTDAIRVCEFIRKHQLASEILFRILIAPDEQKKKRSFLITPDKAIELRNRKRECLCLFIPSDLVDTSSSSIANSFALIDGRALQPLMFKQVVAKLPLDLHPMVRAVSTRSRGIVGVSEEQRLDFALAALRRVQSGESASIGLELWRVGLIVDGGEDFLSRLGKNRECSLSLAHPNKLSATVRERIGNIKVDATTGAVLLQFFRGRAMNDVRHWSQALAAGEGPRFEQWVFPRTDPSDLRSITLTPFRNASGVVERYCHLQQPDGVNGSLLARYGMRETLVVRWKTEPELPKDLRRWRIGIVPEGSEHGFDDCLDERSVIGSRRTVTIKLDMDFAEPPDHAVCIRIAPIGEDGNEIVDPATGQAFYTDSADFFLVKAAGPLPSDPPRKSLSTVPTLAFGRLDFLLEMNGNELREFEPEWIHRDLDYFRLRLNERRVLSLGLSNVLLALEKKTLAEPREGGCFLLDVDEVRAIDVQSCQPQILLGAGGESWQTFWRARETFFKRVKQSDVRAVIEVVDWTPELAASALRYAQAYRELIESLLEQRGQEAEMRQALSIDTLLVRNAHKGNQQAEEAVVILPTHPLRAAWFASYTQLLREWEDLALTYPLRERKRSIDLQALRLLVPTNVPTFAYHVASPTTFVFFQNIRFFHGVALPADVPDPHRRYVDVSAILNTGMDQVSTEDMRPDRLAEHISKFHQLHSYTKTLVMTLINSDRGDFFAEALRQMLRSKPPFDEITKVEEAPSFQIISYAEDRQKNIFQSLEKVRQQQSDQLNSARSDHFLPGLSVATRSVQHLEKYDLPEAHIAVVTDFTRPTVAVERVSLEKAGRMSSFTLYGLVNRFVSHFQVDEHGLLWQHRIVREGVRKSEPHPAGPRYSETLIELHTSLLQAGGYLLGGDRSTQPILEVRLENERQKLLERLHKRTNWVITLDRFFTLDYYDSPNQPGLADLARKHVLDYSPEFTEGLGHRMMVTTSWHEEISSLLGHAMNELGFASIERSVGYLLHHLKMISGRLALEALETPNAASAAVGLGVVTAWLQRNKKLRQAVLVPVDIYPRLFSLAGAGRPARGERRCDLVLFSLKRNIVDATFIEVKWRRGQVPFEGLAQDMILQMEGSMQAIKDRFFNEKRIDGALQRSYLANVLRFYFERSCRYGVFEPEAMETFLEHVTRLEKTGLDFRASYEGYIVSLDSQPRKPLLLDNAKVMILTAQHFENEPEFLPTTNPDLHERNVTPGPLPPELSILQTAELPVLETGQDINQTIERLVLDNLSETITRAVIPEGPSSSEEPGESRESVESERKISIPLGESGGEHVDWKPGVKGSPHLFVLGIPGQGKSWTITRLLAELGKQQVPALVLDFHGQFAESDGVFVKTVHPGVIDAAQGLPFSPFECSRDAGHTGWMANALAVAEIFAYVVGLGDMQKDIVYTAVRDAYEERGFAAESSEPAGNYPTIKEVLTKIEQQEQSRHGKNVVARCRPLLEMDLFRPGEHSLDLLTLVRSGLVVDLHHLFAESLQMAAGAFILRKIYKDMFRWGTAQRLRLAIVLDEAHRLARDITLPKLMKEGRKFGVSVIVASQGMSDFHPDVLSNAGTKVIFRMNYPESRKVAGFIRAHQGQDLSQRIEQLSIGSAYVQTPEMSYGSVVKMTPLEE